MFGVGGSEAIARDMNTLLFSSTYKHSQGDFTKHREFMSSDLYTHHQHQHQHQQQQEEQLQQSSALLRNRSAPGTFFASLLDSGDNGSETYLNPQSSSPESETIFAGFSSGEPDSRDLLHYPTTVMKHEATDSVPEQNNYSIYNTAPTRDLHTHQSLNSVSSMENSYNVMNSTGMEILNPLKKSNGDCSNLIRQSSSPAGFLSYLSTENEFADVRDGRSNSNTNKRIGVEPSATTSRLSNQMNCSRFNPHSAENGMGNTGKLTPENSRLGSNNNDTNGCYIPSIPNDWNNSTSFNGLKRNRDGDVKMFSGSIGLNTQGNGECGQYTPGLVHHMSLPKTSAEMAAVEKYLQFEQDTVPCKIRAKRGFATHPRSIAERVRRTRISERMRKLQELFPNMDKQANTADMLDMAVEYIKDLQKEVQTLKEVRSKCTCFCKQSPAT